MLIREAFHIRIVEEGAESGAVRTMKQICCMSLKY
jgi:hypothetical protein